MSHCDMLKLKWLKVEAFSYLQTKEYEMIVEYTTRYQTGKTPSFSKDEIVKLNDVYRRARRLDHEVRH